MEGVPGSDYINASYVDVRQYIAVSLIVDYMLVFFFLITYVKHVCLGSCSTCTECVFLENGQMFNLSGHFWEAVHVNFVLCCTLVVHTLYVYGTCM